MHDARFEVRDAIHGFVKLTRAEWNIVNLPAYQRLRDIRQLAMGHMVYPGANHTRLEHSIGCVHLSTVVLDHLYEKCADRLKEEYDIHRDNFPRVKRILRLAALLHDIGHPPFSHSGEDLLPPLKRKGRPVKKDGKVVRIDHEEMTARLIRESEIGDKIKEHYQTDGITCDDVIAVATKATSAHQIILNTILTGDLGADRIDYLLRDSYHSGQKSGEFDYRRLIAAISLVAKPAEAGEGTVVGVDESGWLVAEQMIVARYLMYIAVYFHKTKRIFEKHLEDFMRAWLESGGGHLPEKIEDYIRMTDSTVLAAIGEAARRRAAPGHSFAVRFINRSHMRLAREIILADNFKLTGQRRVPDAERFKSLGLHVSDVFGNMVRVDSPDHSATKMFDKSRILAWFKSALHN